MPKMGAGSPVAASSVAIRNVFVDMPAGHDWDTAVRKSLIDVGVEEVVDVAQADCVISSAEVDRHLYNRLMQILRRDNHVSNDDLAKFAKLPTAEALAVVEAAARPAGASSAAAAATAAAPAAAAPEAAAPEAAAGFPHAHAHAHAHARGQRAGMSVDEFWRLCAEKWILVQLETLRSGSSSHANARLNGIVTEPHSPRASRSATAAAAAAAAAADVAAMQALASPPPRTAAAEPHGNDQSSRFSAAVFQACILALPVTAVGRWLAYSSKHLHPARDSAASAADAGSASPRRARNGQLSGGKACPEKRLSVHPAARGAAKNLFRLYTSRPREQMRAIISEVVDDPPQLHRDGHLDFGSPFRPLPPPTLPTQQPAQPQQLPQQQKQQQQQQQQQQQPTLPLLKQEQPVLPQQSPSGVSSVDPPHRKQQSNVHQPQHKHSPLSSEQLLLQRSQQPQQPQPPHVFSGQAAVKSAANAADAAGAAVSGGPRAVVAPGSPTAIAPSRPAADGAAAPRRRRPIVLSMSRLTPEQLALRNYEALFRAPKQGFCEHCHVHFPNLLLHIVTEEHREAIKNQLQGELFKWLQN
jgi:hypothetical protein